ncbi:MAG: 5-oxoprolinase subunit PxpA [Chitinophagaceae bacterium]
MSSIDLNCDMGEGFAFDAALMPFISSANIACGFHAGDKDTMRRTVALALQHNVAIGAHPSYPDRENFGRIDILGSSVQLSELHNIITEQIALLQQVCVEMGASLHHVKPHGALYNRAARDQAVSALICEAIAAVDPALQFYGLSGSLMQQEAELRQFTFISEVFADRTYQDDGSLTPRSQSNALIEEDGIALQQVLQMIQQGSVTAASGKTVPLHADTICIHGDGAHAVAFARMINETFQQQNITVSTSQKHKTP